MKTFLHFCGAWFRAAVLLLSITGLHAGDLTVTRDEWWRELDLLEKISVPAANVTSTWNAAVDGNWDDATKWSSNPNYPNNGNGGVPTFAAVISATGAAYTVTLAVPITVESLLISSANATVNHTANTFTATNGISLNAGTYQLNGGTISNTVVNVSGGILAIAANSNNLLNGVTVNGDLTLSTGAARTKLDGGTTFTNAHLSGNSSELGFAPNQTLSGTILFEGSGGSGRYVDTTTTGNFTIGSTGVIRSETGFGGSGNIGGGFNFSGAMALFNQGLISSQINGTTITLQPTSFSNTGTVQALNGGILTISPVNAYTNGGTIALDATSTVNLAGTFNTSGGIGTFSNTMGGLVNITGTVNNTGNTLTLNNATGSWTLAGGTINGGSIGFADGKTLLIAANSNNLLNGVTVNGDLTLSTGAARTKLDGGTTFTNAHLSGNSSELGFAPNQTLSGTILFEGSGGSGRYVDTTTTGNFTIGSTGVIRSETGFGGSGNIGGGFNFSGAMALFNQGLISSQISGTTITLQPTSFTNQGTFQAINGGVLSLPIGYTQTSGITRVSGGGTINAINASSVRQTITISGGRLDGNGTINANVANSAVIAPGLPAGQLAISGDLSLTSSSNLQFEIGGTTAGTQYDVLTEAGTVALNLNGTLSVSLINGFNISITPGNTFTIISSNQPITGSFSNVVAGRLTTTDGMGSFAINNVGNNVILGDFQAIPEPSSFFLLGLGAGLLVLRRRRCLS